MIKAKILLTSVLLLILLSSCKNPQSGDSAFRGLPKDSKLIIPEGFSSEGIDESTIKMIQQSADHIDYMFNTLPLSMNQDGPQLIMQDLNFISNDAIAGIPDHCTPMARKIYQSKGNIIMEADVYFEGTCVFQVFIKNEVPLYGNLLSIQGVAFYEGLLEEARRTMPEDIRQSLN